MNPRTEGWIIIIASCIPPIRKLFVIAFKKISTISHVFSSSRGYTVQNEAVELYPPPHTHVYPNHRNDVSVERTKRDNEQYGLAGEGGITKTTDVDITFEGW